VPPPVLFSLPAQPPRPVHPALAAVRLAGVILLLGAVWGTCAYWLHSLQAQERDRLRQLQVERRQRLQQFEDKFMETCKVSRVEARLMTIGCYYLPTALSPVVPDQAGLVRLFSEDCLNSPRGGKIRVLWGVVPAQQPGRAAGQLLAYEETPDDAGRRYVLQGNGLTNTVREAEFQTLLRAAGR
jgi:hypothetical protein